MIIGGLWFPDEIYCGNLNEAVKNNNIQAVEMVLKNPAITMAQILNAATFTLQPNYYDILQILILDSRVHSGDDPAWRSYGCLFTYACECGSREAIEFLFSLDLIDYFHEYTSDLVSLGKRGFNETFAIVLADTRRVVISPYIIFTLMCEIDNHILAKLLLTRPDFGKNDINKNFRVYCEKGYHKIVKLILNDSRFDISLDDFLQEYTSNIPLKVLKYLLVDPRLSEDAKYNWCTWAYDNDNQEIIDILFNQHDIQQTQYPKLEEFKRKYTIQRMSHNRKRKIEQFYADASSENHSRYVIFKGGMKELWE